MLNLEDPLFTPADEETISTSIAASQTGTFGYTGDSGPNKCF
jgi:hypothetical protein